MPRTPRAKTNLTMRMQVSEMTMILRQSFPLGRFHATPWRANPFADVLGEWPPSPWRLVRAVVARWYQWQRETHAEPDEAQLEALIHALCSSSYSFHLPTGARRGEPLRQYQPVEFGWHPADKKKSAMRTYGTSLVQDNYWSVPREHDGSTWWFINGDQWTDALVEVLDRCLERVLYFGRAESFSLLRRVETEVPDVNCVLENVATPNSRPVFVPATTANRTDVEGITNDPDLAARSVPKGAKVLYVRLPKRPAFAEETRPTYGHDECHLIQLAIGWNVAPPPRAVARLTARFRGAVLRELVRIKTNGASTTWTDLDTAVRRQLADMLGKDETGQKLQGHQHTEFFVWLEDGNPTRLLIWRGARAFDRDEQHAVHRAASKEHSWAAAGPDSTEWKVRVVPLDSAVPPPPGFDGTFATDWASSTPFVPTRHHLRGGKPRESESVSNQVRRELVARGLIASGDEVEVQNVREAEWVAVHVPRGMRSSHASIGDRRGYWLELRFARPVCGPLRLGHSSTFGLGMFRPV